MIRKKTRPVSVCTGKGKNTMRNEAGELFKASFLKPDVRIEEDRFVDKKGPRKYRVIPLHKHIHIVSAADIHARKERERLIQEDNKKQEHEEKEEDEEDEEEEETVISYLSNLPDEIIKKATEGDEKEKNGAERKIKFFENENTNEDDDNLKNFPSFYCKGIEGEEDEAVTANRKSEEKKTDKQSSQNIETSPKLKKKKKKKKDKQCKHEEEQDERDQSTTDNKRDKREKKRRPKKEKDDEENSKESEKTETRQSKREPLTEEQAEEVDKKEETNFSKRSTRSTSKKQNDDEEEEGEEFDETNEQKREVKIDVQRGRSVKTKIKINFHDKKSLKRFDNFTLAFDTE